MLFYCVTIIALLNKKHFRYVYWKLIWLLNGLWIVIVFQQHLGTVVQLEQENRSLRELSISSGSGTSGAAATGPHESDALRKEKERHAREMKLLRKTIEEMELRIETQKQTLSTRDESIKKLMDMLQSKCEHFFLNFQKTNFWLSWGSFVVAVCIIWSVFSNS